tara:strand:+ start:564 stop:896 length:333 start_codon:yes stop_codon:yes gene_type:complete
MEDDKIFLDFRPNDYIIRISPFVDEDGIWTGELQVGSCTTDENNLKDDDYINLMQLTYMILAAIPAMEEDDYVREVLHKHAKGSLEEEKNKTPKRKLESIDGNIINVNFK